MTQHSELVSDSESDADDPVLLRARVAELERQLAVSERRAIAVMNSASLFAFSLVMADETGRIVAQRGLADVALETGTTDRVGEAALAAIERVIEERERVDQTVTFQGPPHNVSAVTALPIIDDDRTFWGCLVVIRALGDRDDLDSGRRDFVANLSHELKTPIGALGLLAETLLVEHDPIVTERLVRRMHGEAIRVGQVIDDLLNLSRLEASLPMAIESVPARSIIESAITRVRYTAEHRNITISVEGDTDAMLFGVDRELVSAMHHLLENGLKYSPDNSSIEVVVRALDAWTEISVVDHGVGIASEYLDRIFERFYRVDNARTRTTGGTGLGLAIVRRVVHNHGGEVQVQSEEGRGSIFTLRLAARPAHDGGQSLGGTHG